MNPFVNLYTFFRTKRLLLFITVLSCIGLFAWMALRLKTVEDISTFLPKTEGLERINQAMQRMKIRDKIVINLHLRDTSSENTLLLTEMADICAIGRPNLVTPRSPATRSAGPIPL